jgi:hypothetical protein
MVTGFKNTCTGSKYILKVPLEIVNVSMIMPTVFLGTLSGSLNMVKVSQDIVIGSQDMLTCPQDTHTIDDLYLPKLRYKRQNRINGEKRYTCRP